MFRLFSTSRWPVLQIVLAICVPLCCCRLNVLLATLPDRHADAGPAASADPDHQSCCQSRPAAPVDSSDSSEHESEPPPCSGSDACCLKGTTPAPGIGFSLEIAVACVAASPSTEAMPDRGVAAVGRSNAHRSAPHVALWRRHCALLL
jgi:hypothetical protein